MSQTPSPAAPEQETHNGSLPASVVPWYRRPLFWGLLFFLGLLLLAVWLFWKEWQAAENLKGQIASETTALQKQNQAREDFLARLRQLLKEEPCEVQRKLPLVSPPPGIAWPPLADGAARSGDVLPVTSEPSSRPAPTR